MQSSFYVFAQTGNWGMRASRVRGKQAYRGSCRISIWVIFNEVCVCGKGGHVFWFSGLAVSISEVLGCADDTNLTKSWHEVPHNQKALGTLYYLRATSILPA